MDGVVYEFYNSRGPDLLCLKRKGKSKSTGPFRDYLGHTPPSNTNQLPTSLLCLPRHSILIDYARHMVVAVYRRPHSIRVRETRRPENIRSSLNIPMCRSPELFRNNYLFMWARVIVFAFSMLVLSLCSCSTESMTSVAAGTLACRPGDSEPLQDVGGRYGFSLPSELGNKITLKSEYTTMVFETNSRKLVFNGLLIWMNASLIKEHDQWAVTKADVTKIIDPLLRADEILASAGFSTVVIDPGHGGHDTGAIGGRKVYEKKVVLDIAKRVRKKLAAAGVAVKLTRTRDSTIGLSERVARAGEWNADIFVSIHLNSAYNSDAAGLETYVLPAADFPSTAGKNDKSVSFGNKFDKANTLLAYYVHKEMLARTESADRGIRRARFEVLQDAPCPAILVECGFVSNKSEEEKLTQKKCRDTVAEGIAQGILAYINKAKSGKVH